MKEEIAARGYTFPYLVDESQQVAKDYRAACTPDFYLFDADHKLVYRGQMDASRPGNNLPVTGKDLRDGPRRRLGRPARSEGPAAQHGLQHQVAGRERTPVFPLRSSPGKACEVFKNRTGKRGQLFTGPRRISKAPFPCPVV